MTEWTVMAKLRNWSLVTDRRVRDVAAQVTTGTICKWQHDETGEVVEIYRTVEGGVSYFALSIDGEVDEADSSMSRLRRQTTDMMRQHPEGLDA